jgi:hypothetical protein
MVLHAHRQFLLARDLCTISAVFILAGPWGLLLSGHNPYWALSYVFVMFVHYILLMIVARNHGNRFVGNVLAEFSTDNNPGATAADQ